jgi:hypothetical protein
MPLGPEKGLAFGFGAEDRERLQALTDAAATALEQATFELVALFAAVEADLAPARGADGEG